ncbi:MAG TPA: translocation/assembly module TamB domain-containing protein [Steroidobacteraceae bacterium]|nr:translocation/assembly module TamB domain-containing protein [Steroidobacteraceae bacterium]
MKAPPFKKILLWSGGSLALLLLLVAALLAWLLFTTPGARWVASTVTLRFAPQVKYARIDGTIAGELTVTDLQFDGGADKARIRIQSITVDPTLMMLFSRALRIDNARVSGLTLILPPEKDEPEPEEPLWIEPPLDLTVNDFLLTDATIYRENEKLATIRRAELSARWKSRELIIETLTVKPGDIEGDFVVSGRIAPEGDTVRLALKAQWKEVVVPENLAGRVLASHGGIDIEGTPKAYAVKGALDIGPPDELVHVLIDASGTDKRADLRQLELRQSAGHLALSGTVEFKPVAWSLYAKASDFNPGALFAGWPGRLTIDASTRGLLAEAGPRGDLQIATLSGTLRGRPIAGEGEIEFEAPSKFAGDLRVSSGKSRVTVKGSSGDRQQIDATVDLAVASLNDWVPDTRGSLAGRFTIRGEWPKLTIAGSADGKSLGMGENEIAKLHVDATVASPLDPDGELQAVATQITLGGRMLAKVTLDATGNQAKHRVAVSADSEQYDGTVELAGGLTKRGWSGELTRLQLEAVDIGTLTLREPSRVVYDAGNFSLSQTCLEDLPTVLCSAMKFEASGALDAGYSFERVPLKLANALAPDALAGELQGDVQGHGRVRRDANGQWIGDLAVTSESARMVLAQGEDQSESAAAATKLATEGSLLIYENLGLQADFAGMKANAKLSAKLAHGGYLNVSMTVSDLNAPAPRLAGLIQATMPTLAPFGVFVPAVANLDGAVNAEIEVGGTTAKPEFTGNVDATKLQADLGALGIKLRDGRLLGEARRDGGFKLAGSVASGKGHIELDGAMDERGVIEAKIIGQNFLAADIPAANVVVTPDLTLTGDPKGYLLRGEVNIPSAVINLQKFPQDQAPGVSPDVVVIRNGKEVVDEERAKSLPLTAVVTVNLGDDIKVTGYGLDATVTGQLTVREAPDTPTTGSGQVSVAGRYEAYGQKLNIEDGRLLFAGTPLDNPRLAITAMRKVDENLSTGVRIAGTAKRPIITVVSSPEVGEADALSYLVTGRSLSEVGSASGSSQDALNSARQSLSGAGAGLVAKRIGARLGLDEAGVEENDLIGGSALTIGEYLSPRLYLSYGVGLFEPGEVIALRYKLTEDVGVRIQRGTEETRTGVEYRIEK